MGCYVPFHGRNLDVSFFLFRPTIVVVDDLLDALEQFSLYTETLGCVHSCVFKSIHGSMVIWYGAWIKRSNGSKELLTANLLSVLTSISDLAILIDHNFFEPYAGESKDGSPAAVISTGNIVSLNGAVPCENAVQNLSYAFLALFKSCFSHIDGIRAGVCLKSDPVKPRVACLNVWDSLQACYSWILNSDSRSKLQPFVDHLSVDIKYDIFKVVFVSSDAALSCQFLPQKMIGNGDDGAEREQHGDQK
uniref:DUF7392 domain-containing protein n=1 Tax=Kalanchoe fedtschenkoi TaxID=63787 RepID=A0A7N0SWG5_KALFE